MVAHGPTGTKPRRGDTETTMKSRTSIAQVLRRRTLVFGIASIVVFSLCSTAEAAKGTAEVGVDVGVTDLTDNGGNDSGTRFGLRGGYNFTPRWGLEGQAGRTSADEAGADAKLSTLFVNGVFNFRPESRIEPYVLTGVGVAKLKLAAPGLGRVDDSGEAFQVGAGSRFFVDDQRTLSLRVEVSRLRERTFDQNTDYNNVTTGVTWKPGRRS